MEPLSVLLVEDVPDNANLAGMVFERAGFSVTTVTTGADALAALEEKSFGVIALDLRLPDVDGHELATRMKADPRLARTPIVAITALAMKGDREHALEAGCDAYITKPINTRTLADDIRRIVDEFRGAGAPTAGG